VKLLVFNVHVAYLVVIVSQHLNKIVMQFYSL